MKFLFPVFMTYNSDTIRYFSFHVRNSVSTRQHSRGSTTLKVETAVDVFNSLVPASHQAKKGFPYWLGCLILIIKGKLGCFYTVGVGRSVSGMQEISEGVSEVPPCTVTSSMRNCSDSVQAVLTKAQTLQEGRFGLSDQAANCGHLKCLLRAKNLEGGR